MPLVGQTEAGSAEVQPVRLRSGQALPGIANPKRRIGVGTAAHAYHPTISNKTIRGLVMP